MHWIRLTFLLLLLPVMARARLIRGDYFGVRPMGMGNAFLALSDDANVLWYNPAALAWVKGSHFNLIDFGLGADNADTLSRLGKAAAGSYNDLLRLDGPEFFRASLRPTFVSPFFGISIYDNLSGFSDLSNLSSLDLMADIFYVNDLGIITGIAIPVGPEISLGMTLKGFVRSNIDAYVTVKDLLDSLEIGEDINFSSAAVDYLKQLIGVGYALGCNVGAMWRVPLGTKNPILTVAGTIEDLGWTSFITYGSFPKPKAIRQTTNLGIHLQYNLDSKRNHQLNITTDYRDVHNNTPIWQRLHVGAEYRHKAFGFRGGLHQGYWTAGVSTEFPPHTRVHFSSFAVELGENQWTNAHRWYLLEIVVGFNPL